jgi:hypothetical protein
MRRRRCTQRLLSVSMLDLVYKTRQIRSDEFELLLRLQFAAGRLVELVALRQ